MSKLKTLSCANNYLEELYGAKVGFLLGWVQSVISYPASVAAQAIAFATYSAYFIPMTLWQQRFLAFGVLSLLLVLNIGNLIEMLGK